MMTIHLPFKPIVLGALLLTLAGCGRPSADFQYAFTDRHPIVQTRIDRIEVAALVPSSTDLARVRGIARAYRSVGQGKIAIFVPIAQPVSAGAGVWVKQELIAQGVSPNRIQWDARPLPQGIVRVAFQGQGTRNPPRCTNIHEDVQQRENDTSWLNRETVNFGCAYQANIAMQADDNADFLRPRMEGPIDPVRAAETVRRRRANIGDVPPALPSAGTTAP